MTTKATEQEIRKAVRRHIGVSVAAALAIIVLVVFDGIPPMVVVGIALFVAVVVAGSSMHLFSERPAIQVLIGFTAFFVFMLISWSYEDFKDEIEGTAAGTYDGVSSVQPEESH